jgi:hypothetical protein
MTLTLPHGARTMRRDTATWAVRADVVVIANTRHTFSGEPEQTIRASTIEHRSRPPHPAPRTVTIAIRPSHRDETKELNPITADLSRAQLVRSAVLLAVFSDGRIGVNV